MIWHSFGLIEYRMAKQIKHQFSGLSENLIGRGESIAVAESVTAGHLQVLLSSAPEATSFFQGGITAYNIGQKCRHLHIDPIQAESCNCVSEKIAIDMANNVAKLFSSQWGIAVVGYASPVPELKIKKLFAYYAVSYKGRPVEISCMPCPRMQMAKAQKFYAEKIVARLASLTAPENRL